MSAINESIRSELIGFIDVFWTRDRLDHRTDDDVRIDDNKVKSWLAFFDEGPL